MLVSTTKFKIFAIIILIIKNEYYKLSFGFKIKNYVYQNN